MWFSSSFHRDGVPSREILSPLQLLLITHEKSVSPLRSPFIVYRDQQDTRKWKRPRGIIKLSPRFPHNIAVKLFSDER